MPNVINQN